MVHHISSYQCLSGIAYNTDIKWYALHGGTLGKGTPKPTQAYRHQDDISTRSGTKIVNLDLKQLT